MVKPYFELYHFQFLKLECLNHCLLSCVYSCDNLPQDPSSSEHLVKSLDRYNGCGVGMHGRLYVSDKYREDTDDDDDNVVGFCISSRNQNAGWLGLHNFLAPACTRAHRDRCVHDTSCGRWALGL